METFFFVFTNLWRINSKTPLSKNAIFIFGFCFSRVFVCFCADRQTGIEEESESPSVPPRNRWLD